MRRLNACIRWTGLLCAVCLVAVWVLSCFWKGYVALEFGKHECFVSVRYGCIELKMYERIYFDMTSSIERVPAPRHLALIFPRYGMKRDVALFGQRDAIIQVVTIPFWLLLLIISIPTAFLFYRARKRIPQGHCTSCGYNLTGNISGTCPECGVKI